MASADKRCAESPAHLHKRQAASSRPSVRCCTQHVEPAAQPSPRTCQVALSALAHAPLQRSSPGCKTLSKIKWPEVAAGLRLKSFPVPLELGRAGWQVLKLGQGLQR